MFICIVFSIQPHCSHCIQRQVKFINVALRKNSKNLKGTGGGAGEPLSTVEQLALNTYKKRGSDLIQGIPGAFESSFSSSSRSDAVFCVQVVLDVTRLLTFTWLHSTDTTKKLISFYTHSLSLHPTFWLRILKQLQ